jgi:hypothetical protein
VRSDLKNNHHKNGWQNGSSGSIFLPSKHRGPEFKPQYDPQILFVCLFFHCDKYLREQQKEERFVVAQAMVTWFHCFWAVLKYSMVSRKGVGAELLTSWHRKQRWQKKGPGTRRNLQVSRVHRSDLLLPTRLTPSFPSPPNNATKV